MKKRSLSALEAKKECILKKSRNILEIQKCCAKNIWLEMAISPTHHHVWEALHNKDDLNVSEFTNFDYFVSYVTLHNLKEGI